MGLILNESECERLDAALRELLQQSDGKCAVLIDQDGRCLVRHGLSGMIDCDALAALVAGSFASTRALAKLVGESEFTVLFHQGEKDHIHNILVDDDTILTVIFDDRTTVGMVRLYSKEAIPAIERILAEARMKTAEGRMQGEAADAREALNQLDNIFQD